MCVSLSASACLSAHTPVFLYLSVLSLAFYLSDELSDLPVTLVTDCLCLLLFVCLSVCLVTDCLLDNVLTYCKVNKGRNPQHLLHLSMFDGPLMLGVNLPVNLPEKLPVVEKNSPKR